MSNKLTWFIDNQVIQPNNMEKIRDSIKELGSELIEFNLTETISFPPIPEGLFVPYGSTFLVKHCKNIPKDRCLLFFNEENFTTQIWVEKLKDRMLNSDALFCTLKEAQSLDLPNRFFIKPDSDLKSFTGSVVSKEGLDRYIARVDSKEFNFDSSIPVVINTVKNTGWEWRLVMHKDKVIASSSYKLKNMLNLSKDVPTQVIDYAESAAKLWYPEEVYVIDIGESDQGLKIVEFNCFNASGLYNCDIHAIVSKINLLR